MLPDMSNTVLCFAQSIILKTVTQSNDANFNLIEATTETLIQSVVQVADKDKLQIDNINYDLRYLQLHSTHLFSVGDIVSYQDNDYKIISVEDYTDYGYCAGIAEQIRWTI